MTSDLYDQALKNLPHGTEFRFIHSLLELESGKAGRASFTPEGTEEYFRGHFPGTPIVPGVLLIEAVAQLAGIVAQCDPEHPPLKGLRLTAVKGAKILGTAGPGNTFEIRVRIVGRFGNLIQAQGEVLLGADSIVKTEVTLSGEGEPAPSRAEG